MPLYWTDTLATGHRQIDLQHQELIDLINELESAVLAGHPAEALREVMPKLNAYILFHFGTEETLLNHVNLNHAAAHRRQHRAFSARMATLQAAPQTDLETGELVDYLKHWLIDHIMKTDRELARQLLTHPRTSQ